MIKVVVANADGTYEEPNMASSKKYANSSLLSDKEIELIKEIQQKEIWYWCNECKETLDKLDITEDYHCKKHGTEVYDLRDCID